MIDAYVTCIRQVAALLGYGEPQFLEVFKNTLPTKLYWILFPIEDHRQVVETAKRILAKEKLDRQLTRTIFFHPIYEYQIDKLPVVIGKLEQEIVGQVDSSNHKSIKVQVEVRTEITIRETIRIGIDQITDQIRVTEDNTDKTEVGLDTNKIIGEVILD